MTDEQFISLVKQPETVSEEHLSDLKEMVERYPYFVPARVLMVKSMQQSRSIHFLAELKLAALYCSARRWFYYYIYPEKNLSTELYKPERTGKSSGNYFDMIETVEKEGGDAKQSLKNLAERLREAREMVHSPIVKALPKVAKQPNFEQEVVLPKQEFVKPNNPVFSKAEVQLTHYALADEKVPLGDYFSFVNVESTEQDAKKMIKERKYAEAIEILKQLNLNNPKKSVYFADQIRFLEKIIANSKK